MMKRIHFLGIAIAFYLGLLIICPPFSVGQEAAVKPMEESASGPATAESETIAPLQIKLSVSEVQLDVVVTDNRGRPVTDLKTADFEVFQNGAKQNVLSSIYVVNQADIAAQPSASRKDNRNLPALPTAKLKKEDTRRTIIFVLDEISMNLENMYNAKMALRNFVEKQMQPGDMVAILSTGRGNSALQMFLSDKNQLSARINAMRMTSPPIDPAPDDSHLHIVYDNQLFTLSYSIRALKDMPGRKILNVITAQTTLSVPTVRVLSESPIERINFYDAYNGRFGRLAEDALRSGVVINFLNINGLQSPSRIQGVSVMGLNERDIKSTTYTGVKNVNDPKSHDGSVVDPSVNNDSNVVSPYSLRRDELVKPSEIVRVLLEEYETDAYENTLDARGLINPLPDKTGGVLIENSNFFLDGIGKDVDNLMKGYYLVSYEPPGDTFSADEKEIFNQVKINVKRRNVRVYTRDGFYNRQESENDTASPRAHPLQNAIFSPFLHADLSVNMASGYIRDAKAGYLVRSWIHLDPKDVTIRETEDGGGLVDFEIVCLTSDISGNVHDLVEAKYTFNIDPEKKAENIAWMKKHGIRFSMLLPVKKPGSYYVRAAVHDKESGKVGSAYQFIEIPDISKRNLELSSMFMITGAEDLNWMISAAPEGIGSGLFFPVFQAEEVRSPALRTYEMGNRLQALTMIYNADEKAVAGAEIETQSILYKDGKEFMRSAPRPVNPGSAGDHLEGIPISQTLTMGSDLGPGDYVLQLVVTDKKNSTKKDGNAAQTLSFTIMEK